MNNIIKDFISTEYIPVGISNRYDCPICNGTNTLSVTNFGNEIKYYCFHSDCSRGGVIKEGLSDNSFETSSSIVKDKPSFNILDYKNNFSLELICRPECVDYLEKNNCWEAWWNNRADIRYDFKQNRMVFIINDGSKIVDAVGRALGDKLPKWYRYGNSGAPYICGNHSTAVLVEDAASATAVSSFATGVAMLGTNLSEKAINKLSSYKKVLVCLDEDASDKAIHIAQRLHWVVEKVEIRILTRDLKRLKTNEAKKVLKLDD